MKRALICGVTGQDGAYLARLLVHHGYEVHGTSRAPSTRRIKRLRALGVADAVRTHALEPTNEENVRHVLRNVRPDEIYHLAAQSSVAASLTDPLETIKSIVTSTAVLLDACSRVRRETRVFFAGSGECFGDTLGTPASETTPCRPANPYGVAKASAFWLVESHRRTFGSYVSTGILYNHESPLRPDNFVTRKVVRAACAIANGKADRLRLGDVRIVRDWGWADEFVQAIWSMLQLREPADFVIATGESNSLEDFVTAVFAEVGLDSRNHVDHDPSLRRPGDIAVMSADPGKASRELAWKARYRMRDVARLLVAAELGRNPY